MLLGGQTPLSPRVTCEPRTKTGSKLMFGILSNGSRVLKPVYAPWMLNIFSDVMLQTRKSSGCVVTFEHRRRCSSDEHRPLLVFAGKSWVGFLKRVSGGVVLKPTRENSLIHVSPTQRLKKNAWHFCPTVTQKCKRHFLTSCERAKKTLTTGDIKFLHYCNESWMKL